MSPKNPLSKHSLHTTDKWDFSFRRQIYKDLNSSQNEIFSRFRARNNIIEFEGLKIARIYLGIWFYRCEETTGGKNTAL